MPLPTWLPQALGLLAVAAVFVVVPYALTLGAQFRLPRQVRCPETGSAETVAVGIARQTVYSLLPVCDPVRLCSCTRWPARSACDQACARQL
jgi:hypothetical protein